MVKLHVKRDNEDLFLFETSVTKTVGEILQNIVQIQNGRMKVLRLSYELKMLSCHGAALPTSMHGLTDEQIEELKLIDEWTNKFESEKNEVKKDVCNKRNGFPPPQRMIDIIEKSIEEAKIKISSDNVKSGKYVTEEIVEEALDILKGAVIIAYPMNLPEYDPIRREFENEEAISSNSDLLDIDVAENELWFATKQMIPEKKLCDYFGSNEKSKVIVKLQVKGAGIPVREPRMSEEERKEFMFASFKRQEEIKKLMMDDDDSYHDSRWADPNSLKKAFHGLEKIRWK